MSDLFADVSSYQGTDLTYIKNLGAKGVVIKLTEGSANGTAYVNPNAAGQVTSALNLGLQVAFYHYALYTGQQDARSEADFFSDQAKRLGFNGDAVMVADVEDPGILYTDTYNNTLAFTGRLKELGWSKVSVYSMASWFQAGKLPTNDAIWVASYGTSSPGVDGASAWQFTSTYVTGGLDMSYDFTGLFTTEQFGGSQPTQTAKPAVNPDDVITVTSGAAEGFREDGNIIDGSFTVLHQGTQWQSYGIKVVAGEPQYLIGENFYLPQKYTDQAGICTIRGSHDYGYQSINDIGTGWRFSEYYFKGGSQWKVLDTKTINDKLYYRVSALDYIDADATHGSAK